MKNTFFRRILATLITVSIVSTSAFLAPKRGEAIVGLATGAAPLVIAGGVVAVAALPAGLALGYGATMIAAENGGGWSSLLGIFVGFWLGVAGAVAGVIMLEDGSEAVQFRSLSVQDAARAALSPEEVRAWNSSIEELNVIAQDAGIEVQKAMRLGQEQALRASAQRWEEALSRESPDLREALKKVFQMQLRAASTH